MGIAVYIHVPFCRSICSYCDFCRIVASEQTIETWLTTILDEIEEKRPVLAGKGGLDTLYIGGGTPSLLSSKQFTALIEPFLQYFHSDTECTIECNPESLDQDKIETYAKYGVNRISLGVQSFQDEIVHSIGRHHTKEQVLQAITWLREAGIENISIDLMYALPQQTRSQIKNDLDLFFSLKLPHLSIYSLILEENSIFAKRGVQPIDEDEEADQYEMIVKTLKEHGYLHYEISSFALPDRFSKHNLAYWQDRDFIGIGCGASGKEDGQRYAHTNDVYAYIQGDTSLVQEETDLAFEAIMMALRTSFGLDLKAYERRYGIDLVKKAGWILEKYHDELFVDGDRFWANEKGREKLNSILVDFLDVFE